MHQKIPRHCGKTFAEYFREIRNPPPFLKVPRRFKCPAPSTWLQHSLGKGFVMFYVLILYIFVGIILIRGSVWHVFMQGEAGWVAASERGGSVYWLLS